MAEWGPIRITEELLDRVRSESDPDAGRPTAGEWRSQIERVIASTNQEVSMTDQPNHPHSDPLAEPIETDEQKTTKQAFPNDFRDPPPHAKVMQFFQFAHLPPLLQGVSEMFAQLAHRICQNCPDNRERDKALDRLLEAKDCAVRAVLHK